MAKVIQQARIVDAAGLVIERGIGGAGDRHRRFDADRSVDARQRPRAEALARLPSPEALSCSIVCARRLKRERLAGAGRSQDRRQKRRLDLRGHAKMSQRLHDLAGVQEVRPVGRIAKEDRLSPDWQRQAEGARSKRAARPIAPGPLAGVGKDRLVARPDVPKQANLRIHAWLGQSILLNARSGKRAERRLI